MKPALLIHKYSVVFILSLFFVGYSNLFSQAEVTIKSVAERQDTGSKAIDITYEIKYNPTGGTDLQLEVSTDGGASFEVKPQGKEVIGDVNRVKGNGTKVMTWYPEKTASIKPGIYEKCIAQIKVPGGEPTGATLTIGKFRDNSWQSIGVVEMSGLEKTGEFKPSHSCAAERGDWSAEPTARGAIFYKASNVKNFPNYVANPSFAGPTTGQGCSSFIAVTDQGTEDEEVWVNFTNEFNRESKTVPGVFTNWEVQIRFYKKKNKNYEAIKIGDVNRNNQWGEIDTLTEYNVNVYYDGAEKAVKSQTFKLNLGRKVWAFGTQGDTTLKFSVQGSDDKAYWFGAGDGKIKAENHVVSINNFLKFSGNYIQIDTTNGFFEFDGKVYLEGIPDLFTNAPGELVLLNGQYSTLKLGNAIFTELAEQAITHVVIALNMAGFRVIPSNVTFIDGTNASGIKLDLDFIIEGLNKYCGNDWSVPAKNASAIRILGVSITTQGIGFDGINVQNVGIAAIPYLDKEKGGACIKNLTIKKNSEEKSLECSILLKFPPIIEEVAGGFKLINGKLDGFGLKLKIEAGFGVPMPEPPPPAHIIEWQGFETLVKGMVKSPFETSLSVLFTNNTKIVPAQYKDFAKLFEYTGTFHLVWPNLWEFTVNGRFIKIWDAWIAQAEDKVSLNLSPFTLSRYGKISFFNLGGSSWIFDGIGGGSFCFSPFQISGTQSGSITIPDLFAKNTYFTELNRILKLPWHFAGVTAEQRNSKFGFGVDFAPIKELSDLGQMNIVIDMTKRMSDFSFIKFSKGTSLNLNSSLRIDDTPVANIFPGGLNPETLHFSEMKQNSQNEILANDTTWVTVPATAGMNIMFISLFGEKAPNKSVLLTPSQQLLKETNNDSTIVFYPDDPDFPNHSMWVVRKPAPGNWKLGIIDRGANDSIRVFSFNSGRDEFDFDLNEQGRNINLSWKSNDAPDSSVVDVYIDKDSLGYDGIYIGTTNEKNGQLSFQLTDSLKECKYYIYAVRWDNDVVSRKYFPQPVTNPKAALPPPENLLISSNEAGHTRISWTPPTDKNVVGYIIKVIDESGKDSTYLVANAFLENEVEIDIKDHTTKKIQIVAFNSTGLTGCPSEQFSIPTDVIESPVAGLDFNDSPISIQPNPSTNKATIGFNNPSAGNINLGIYDLLGNNIAELANGFYGEGIISREVVTSGMTPGLYFVRLTVNGEVITKKMSVSR